MIKNIFTWAGVFVAAFLLQTTLISHISILGVKPDLLLVVLFFLATKIGIMPAVFVGFFLGLAQDLYSPSVLGQNALSNTIAGFFAGLFNERVMRLDPIFQSILLVLTFMVNDGVFIAVQVMKSGGSLHTVIPELFTMTLPRALYSLLLAVLPIVWQFLFQAATTKR
jgi:rod shape-determining protein MreD